MLVDGIKQKKAGKRQSFEPKGMLAKWSAAKRFDFNFATSTFRLARERLASGGKQRVDASSALPLSPPLTSGPGSSSWHALFQELFRILCRFLTLYECM